MANPTQGMEIRDVRLIASSFHWKPDSNDKIAKLEPAARRTTTTSDVKTEDLVLPEGSGHRCTVVVAVKTVGFMGPVECWEITVAYEGEFYVATGSDVSPEAVKSIHAPAILYGFCREHVADLTRRARLTRQVLLAPMNFQAGATPPGI